MSRFVHEHPDRKLNSYAPSFYEDGWLNSTQRGLVEALADHRGKLADADHFKLYEAAYFARGPIVEIGRLAGKSTICLALGARDGSGQPVYSIELVLKYLPLTEEGLSRFGVLDGVTLIQGDSAVQATRVPRPVDTVFIDGSHIYEGVARDIQALRGVLAPGAVLMFHDYRHSANRTGEYGVRRAVDEAALGPFRGCFGGIAMFEFGGDAQSDGVASA